MEFDYHDTEKKPKVKVMDMPDLAKKVLPLSGGGQFDFKNSSLSKRL